MVVTELKMGFQKLKPHIAACVLRISTLIMKSFDQTFKTASEKNLKCFKETVFCIFNRHAPVKRKYVRANEAPFMTKELHEVS